MKFSGETTESNEYRWN